MKKECRTLTTVSEIKVPKVPIKVQMLALRWYKPIIVQLASNISQIFYPKRTLLYFQGIPRKKLRPITFQGNLIL